MQRACELVAVRQRHEVSRLVDLFGHQLFGSEKTSLLATGSEVNNWCVWQAARMAEQGSGVGKYPGKWPADSKG